MKEYLDQKIEDHRFSGNVEIRDKKFIKCLFSACRLSVPYTVIPDDRTRVIDCAFINCEFHGRSSFQSKGYLQNVLFHNIKNSDYLRIGGVIFDRVTFKGKFDKWIIDSDHHGMLIGYDSISDKDCTVLNNYTAVQYANIDWALDIAEAEFKECDLRASIPSRLIKRNPETQMLLKYEKVLNSSWSTNPKIMQSKNSYLQLFCKRVERYKKDTIIVASVRNKKEFEKDMEAIKILRQEGIGELD